MAQLPRLIRRGRALDVLLGAGDIDGELAERRGLSIDRSLMPISVPSSVLSRIVYRRRLTFDPKGLVRERTYEVANLLGNPWPYGGLVHDPERMLHLAHRYAARLGLESRRVLGFALAHAGLSASWSMDDDGDPAYRLTCTAILDPLVGAMG